MKIIINSSKNYTSGGLQVALSFINECITHREHEFHVFLNPNIDNMIDKNLYPNNFKFYQIPLLKHYQFQSFLSKLERQIQPEVVFSIFGPVYWRPKALHVMGFAMGHYIYNDSPYWELTSWKENLFWWLKKKIHYYYLKKDADIFITETTDATKRLHKWLKKPCYTVSNTYSRYFEEYHISKSRKQILPPKSSNEFRLLSLCRPYPHKNLSIIPKVLEYLNHKGYRNIRFVVTMQEDAYNQIIPHKYQKYVYNVGIIPPSIAPQLYAESDATFIPTLLECFTANYPEAMVMCKTIITSDLGFSHAICGNAALYYSPMDAKEAAEMIIQVSNDVSLQEKLVNNGLQRLSLFKTASQRADAILEICLKQI